MLLHALVFQYRKKKFMMCILLKKNDKRNLGNDLTTFKMKGTGQRLWPVEGYGKPCVSYDMTSTYLKDEDKRSRVPVRALTHLPSP